MKKQLDLSAEQLAKKIDWPLDQWPGACYGVAGAIQRYVGGELRYGHWLGLVSPNCPVEGFKHGTPFQRHGWIERDGEIIDPTRWVFEGVEPYIYVGPNDHYDAGGNALREALLGPCPDYSAYEERTTLAVWKFDRAAHRFVMEELFGGSPGITKPMAWWLANLPLPRLGVFAQPIYRALIDCGMSARIPIDNRRLVLGQ